MKTLEKGQDKIKKICTVLREETLAPALVQSEKIIEDAHAEAKNIIEEAKKAAAKLHVDAKAFMERERTAFQSSLQQAAKQSVQALRQSIEQTFFNQRLPALINEKANDPQLISKLIDAIVKALEKDGLSANITALVGKDVMPSEVNSLLLADVVNVLKGGSVELGALQSGVQLKLKDQHLTIDMSGDAIQELLSGYMVRKDFRKLIFDANA